MKFSFYLSHFPSHLLLLLLFVFGEFVCLFFREFQSYLVVVFTHTSFPHSKADAFVTLRMSNGSFTKHIRLCCGSLAYKAGALTLSCPLALLNFSLLLSFALLFYYSFFVFWPLPFPPYSLLTFLPLPLYSLPFLFHSLDLLSLLPLLPLSHRNSDLLSTFFLFISQVILPSFGPFPTLTFC